MKVKKDTLTQTGDIFLTLGGYVPDKERSDSVVKCFRLVVSLSKTHYLLS